MPFAILFVGPFNRKFTRFHQANGTLNCRTVMSTGKGNGKFHTRTGHEGPEWEYRYSSTLSLTSALDEVVCSAPSPSRFTSGEETRYQSYRSLGRPRAGLDGCGKSRPPPTGIRSPDRAARSESLYRLSYPGQPFIMTSSVKVNTSCQWKNK